MEELTGNIDFKLTDSLDLDVSDGVYTVQEDGETTMLQAFFTDARISGKRGYWLDIQKSEVWRYDQARLINETAVDLNATAKEVAQELVVSGLYTRIETNTFISDGAITLQIQCYNKNNIVVDRKFVI